jgi:hypothetical protein
MTTESSAGVVDEENIQTPGSFTVRLGEEVSTTSAAVLTVRHYAHRPAQAELSFTVNNSSRTISLVAQTGLDLVHSKTLATTLTEPGQATERSVALAVDGETVSQGKFEMVLSEGSVTGTVKDLPDPLAFSGPLVVFCLVPGTTGDAKLQPPTPIHVGGIPTGEALVRDASFSSEACSTVRDLLSLR